MNDESKRWISLANYDIETAKTMLNAKSYEHVNVVCFQCVKKALKAVISNNNETPPNGHNLIELADIGNLCDLMNDEQTNLLYILDPLKMPIISSDDETICNDLIAKTEGLIEWIKQQL